MTAEHNSVDALMAAITGERLPDEADDAFRAEHRKAETDLALLRQQLGIIGDALAEGPRPERAPARVRAPRDWRPVRRFAFGTVAVAAVAGVLAGMGWLVSQAGGGANEDSGSASGAKADSAVRSPFSSSGYLACTRLVAEGEVTRVEPVPPGAEQERITLHVTRSYKPEKSKQELTLVIDEGVLQKALHKGDHILVGVPQHAATPDRVLVGEKSIAGERARLTKALSESAHVTCG
ncbi:hypothetical protein [Streptomyces sp. NRRL S-646]|uniref:hypothetical protein n=1 Tax=Streptomyces sp. NRRL S-646 TaxID=1463917 RepID=UPI0004C54DC0|nr:hypothetical protein [Streptomyces sp. NRRL S-646]